MKPRGRLMIEHRLIEKFLALADLKAGAMSTSPHDPLLLDAIVDFVRTYADLTHHGKEEGILFSALSEKIMSQVDFDAMKHLAQDHAEAREKVREIVELNEEFRKGDGTVVPRIREIISWLGTFYPAHIRKEDASFFPETERYFSAEELETMLASFNDFDRNMIHEKYRVLYDTLGGTPRE